MGRIHIVSCEVSAHYIDTCLRMASCDLHLFAVHVYIYTETKKKLPLCLSADIHKYENRD